MTLFEDTRDVFRRTLLTEGKFDREVTTVSRWFVKELKLSLKQVPQDEKFAVEYTVRSRKFLDQLGIGHLNRLNIVVAAGRSASIEKFGKHYKTTIRTGSQSVTQHDVELTLRVPMPFSKTHWGNLIATFKELLRHELEHSVQNSARYAPYDARGRFTTTTDVIKYFGHLSEVEAFVVGLYKRAKATKDSLSDLIDFNMMKISSILSTLPMYKGGPTQGTDVAKERKRIITAIEKRWRAYAKKRFPKAQ